MLCFFFSKELRALLRKEKAVNVKRKKNVVSEFRRRIGNCVKKKVGVVNKTKTVVKGKEIFFVF